MKLRLAMLAAGLLLTLASHAQKFSTRGGTITFFSATPVEDIEAKNTQVAASFDMSSGQLAFVVPMKAFQFRNGLMQEHFNENYVESEKFPRATFSGRLVAPPAELPAGVAQAVQVEGDLTIHGVTRRVRVPGTLERQGDKLLAKARFDVAPADYKIEIPLLVRDHIAKTVAVAVALVCAPQPLP